LNALLPWLYDQVEPPALRIARRAATLEPADAQRTYLVDVAREIVANGGYRSSPPRGASGEELSATLTWFAIVDEGLERYVAGERSAADLVARGGGRLWAIFQGHEPLCAAWARGVAAAVAPRVRARRVLELEAGTGGTTRLLAHALRGCRELVVSDLRSSFAERIVGWLPGVNAHAAVVDIDDHEDAALGDFDLVYATNCLHVAHDVDRALKRVRGLLRPGGMLVLGEGAHYSARAPSPLSLVLALFDGWWDAPTSATRARQGFLAPEEWLSALRRAGYDVPCAQTWADDRRQFGGVYCARA
jgi:SAM-dependent methyltransferase